MIKKTENFFTVSKQIKYLFFVSNEFVNYSEYV